MSAQTLTLQTGISNALQESSGLLYLNGKLLTHNDSGGEAAIYEMDTSTGVQSRKVIIQNATNIDWEDIAMDKDYIYIGDFGNNQGSRTNLRIFKVSKQDYLSQDTIMADTIRFNYSDQIDFTPSTFSTNYDAEALISYGDSLYIFTKNWGNSHCNIYPLSKSPGDYSLVKTDSLNSQGWITGAVCDSANKQIMLIGYTFNTSFFIKLNNWNNTLFSSGQSNRQIVQPNSSIQIEGIAQIDNTHYFISSEKFQSTNSELHILDCQISTSIEETKRKPLTIYPIPTSDYLNVDFNGNFRLDVFSINGQTMLTSDKTHIDLRLLPSGIYIMRLQSGAMFYYQRLLVK